MSLLFELKENQMKKKPAIQDQMAASVVMENSYIIIIVYIYSTYL